VGGAEEDAMAVAMHIKYALSLNTHITFYSELTTLSSLSNTLIKRTDLT